MDPSSDRPDQSKSDAQQLKHPETLVLTVSSESQPPPESPLPPSAVEARSVGFDGDPAKGAPSAAIAMPAESNPYVTPSPAASSSKSTMETVRNVIGLWGKRVGESTKRAENLGRNVWQHLKTGPSIAEAAMGMIAQGTKVIAEGGYEKIFRHTFDTLPEEQLRTTYSCYLSTSAGPVMGVLYLSTAKLAFCSDNPLSYKAGNQTEWSYYKVVIPLHQLRSATPSTNNSNAAEKYIQIISIDNHEFWFMGFVNYEGAVDSLQEALHNARDLQP